MTKRPTGYTVTLDADVLWLFMRCFGKSCAADRKKNFKHTKELDDRASMSWSRLHDELENDGFPTWEWKDE